MALFKKAAVFGDLHLGLKSNSLVHLSDCLEYIKWFIATAKQNNCETCIFLGDLFHNRNNTNLITLNYGIRCLRMLGDAFDNVYMIPGNHDLYHKDKRDYSSIEWATHISNITIFNELTVLDGVAFVPWLVQDEHTKIANISAKYMMCHIELPKFMMNASVVMPDIGELQAEQFVGVGQVFSGHFHKRQTQKNITYIGNAFPHNFSDANDDDRGMMMLSWGKEPKFFAWPDAPKYRTVNISKLVTNPDDYLPKNGYIKLLLDTTITYEEASYLKETLIEEYELREMSLVSIKNDLFSDDLAPNGNVKFQSVDSIVQGQITNIVSEFYDPNILLDIYRNL